MLEYVVKLVSYVYDSVFKSKKEELYYGSQELYCSTKSIFDILDQLSSLYRLVINTLNDNNITEKEKIIQFLSLLKLNIELIEFFVLNLASNLSNVEINYEMVAHNSNICLMYENSYQKNRLFKVDKKRNIIIIRKILFVKSKIYFDEKVIQFNDLKDIAIFLDRLKKDLNILKKYRLKMKLVMLERYKLEDLF